MSSKPSKEGVEKLRAVIADYRFLAQRAAELRKLLEELPKVEEELREKHREAIKMLEGMDVDARGNTGWEGRMMYFLTELDRQAKEDV